MLNLVKFKIKMKTFAAESRVIRQEELRRRGKNWASEGTPLYFHRIGPLRRTIRENHLAYGFLKGRTYRQLEQHPKTEPNWKNVLKHINNFSLESESQTAVFNLWHIEPEPIKVPHVYKPKKPYIHPSDRLATA